MAEILGHVKATRKDKSSIKFTNHKGEGAENKYAPVFVVWANKFGGGDVKVDKNVSQEQVTKYLFSGDYFLSFFPRKDQPSRDEDF